MLRRCCANLIALLLSAAICVSLAHAQNYQVLYTFTGGTDGGHPSAALLRDSAGNLYGTALNGGDGGSPACGGGGSSPSGCGVVFQLDASGKENVLYTFTGGADGSSPYGGLVRDPAGNLFGTTLYGGLVSSICYPGQCGVVFKLDPSGNETVLHSFVGPPGDGSNSYAGVFLGAAGDLYGTTYYGGMPAHVCRTTPTGCGAVFKVDTAGTETILHNFTAGMDGGHPYAGVVADSAGNFYGTTYEGGAFGNGVVFKLDQSGRETILHSFAGQPDGAKPHAGLILDSAGNLYGTTAGGGGGAHCYAYSGCGVVFKVDASGSESVLFRFAGPPGDGANPNSGLILDSAGSLYGTTSYGGITKGVCAGGGFTARGCGVVFKLDTSGKETVMYRFTGAADGAQPYGSLVRDGTGSLYGTTVYGGAITSAQCSEKLPSILPGCGVVFQLKP